MALNARYQLHVVARKSRKFLFWSAVALSWLAMPAHAARVLGVQVAREGTSFLIGMHIAIDAPPSAVFRALQEYSAMMRYNPDLRAVRVEPTGVRGRVRLFTTMHTCVLVFCKTMHQEQIMTAITGADGGVLEAELLPHGDFKAGGGRWTVKACSTDRTITCLDARVELVPAFWVPPVIGAWVIRKEMVEEARYTSTGLEQMARTPARSPGASRAARRSTLGVQLGVR